jgi:hypothetical protein
MSLLGMAGGLLRASGRKGPAGCIAQATRGLLWSVERETHHVYKDPDAIIDHGAIEAAMAKTKQQAKDPAAIQSILQAAKDRSFLTNYTPGGRPAAAAAAAAAAPLCAGLLTAPRPPRAQASPSTCRGSRWRSAPRCSTSTPATAG